MGGTVLAGYEAYEPGHASMGLEVVEDLLVGLASNLKVARNLKELLLRKR